MSIVHEVTLGAHCGFRILGLALITNKCLSEYDSTVEAGHEDVIRISELKANEVQFVFTVVLPNQDVQLSEVEQKLASKPDLMTSLLSLQGTRTEELLLYLPKFKMEATFNLNDVLIQLGMQDAFSDTKANFTGIVSKEDDPLGLYISKVNNLLIRKRDIEQNMF